LVGKPVYGTIIAVLQKWFDTKPFIYGTEKGFEFVPRERSFLVS
jgi:hypothetical protein